MAGAVAVVDVVTTWVALHTGVGYESNPVAAHGFALLGTELGLVIGLVLRLAVVIGLTAIALQRRQPVAARVALVVLLATVVWWSFIVVSNVQVLAST